MDSCLFLLNFFSYCFKLRYVVELLVARGGDITIGSPLYEATQEGHADVVYFIIQQLRKTCTQTVSL